MTPSHPQDKEDQPQDSFPSNINPILSVGDCLQTLTIDASMLEGCSTRSEEMTRIQKVFSGLQQGEDVQKAWEFLQQVHQEHLANDLDWLLREECCWSHEQEKTSPCAHYQSYSSGSLSLGECLRSESICKKGNDDPLYAFPFSRKQDSWSDSSDHSRSKAPELDASSSEEFEVFEDKVEDEMTDLVKTFGSSYRLPQLEGNSSSQFFSGMSSSWEFDASGLDVLLGASHVRLQPDLNEALLEAEEDNSHDGEAGKEAVAEAEMDDSDQTQKATNGTVKEANYKTRAEASQFLNGEQLMKGALLLDWNRNKATNDNDHSDSMEVAKMPSKKDSNGKRTSIVSSRPSLHRSCSFYGSPELEALAEAFQKELLSRKLLKNHATQFGLKTIEQAFSGKDAVDILQELMPNTEPTTREEALTKGNEMMTCYSFFQHITGDKPLLDTSTNLYQFDRNLSSQVQRMKHQYPSHWDKVRLLEQHLECKDRRHMLRLFPNCFVAREAVDVMMDLRLVKSRKEAVHLMKRLNHKVFCCQHVTREHEFKDEYLFFEFIPRQERMPEPPSFKKKQQASTKAKPSSTPKKKKKKKQPMADGSGRSSVRAHLSEEERKKLNQRRAKEIKQRLADYKQQGVAMRQNKH